MLSDSYLQFAPWYMGNWPSAYQLLIQLALLTPVKIELVQLSSHVRVIAAHCQHFCTEAERERASGSDSVATHHRPTASLEVGGLRAKVTNSVWGHDRY